MRIRLNPSFDIETLAFIGCDDEYECSGPLLHYKGDPTAKAAEQQQMTFDSQLMNIFQQQYGSQSQITKYLTSQLEPTISAGGQGMSPQALAAARTQSTDTLSSQFQGAARALNATQQRDLPSGVSAQLSGSLMAQQAEAQSLGQNQITAQNEAIKQANYWNSINALSGNAAQINPLGYAGSATSGSNAVTGLSQANTQAAGPGLGAIFGGILGGGAQGLASHYGFG
ncbi:MAG TPA: hypothetical protein VGR76_10305 [Candidatus Angelobacter sp.]|jgi:hypothetical protein|nr:hypothetical protein [Candidatus Angelobacter sp.]